ncbi:MAG: hypothetical protein KQH63_19470 [Desulfobulbaceae bacterium]|nr:hypothetical protein [Desulfobulbaceae bacterium]
MTTNGTKYRLGEYIITEHGGILFTWISQVALGVELSGRCLIIGNILVIGPQEHEEAGFLKLEFYEQLMKFPIWGKTAYYCLASSIRKVGTEQSVVPDLIENPYIPKNFEDSAKKIRPGAFRLGRYRINVDKNNIISWQTIGELNKIISGRCVIESGVLFVGPKEDESGDGESRREFLAGQKLLGQWDRTFAWGHYGSLVKCGEPERQRRFAAVWAPEGQKISMANVMPLPQNQQYSREKFHEYTASGTEWFKTTWHRIVEWDVWKRLTPLFIAGVITAFRFSVFLSGKCVSVSIRILKRFRSNHKE